MIVDGVLQTQRADRLVQFAARDRDALTLGETIDSLVATTWSAHANESTKSAALRRVTRRAVTDRILALAANDAERAEWLAMSGDIGRWLDRHELPTPTKALVAPPGDPFGLDP